MNKLECPECVAFLEGQIESGPRFWDIPETLKRMRAVWATQECQGVHDLVAWVTNPNGAIPPTEHSNET